MSVDGRQAGSGRELPLTSYATLGLLTPDCEFSPVEIEERAREYLRFFYWTPALSHIRRELDRLETLGYVECREVMRGRIRRTLKYRLTPEGANAVASWAEAATTERTVQKNSAILKLWAGRRDAESTALLSNLQRHIDFVESERASLREFLRLAELEYEERFTEAASASAMTRAELQAPLLSLKRFLAVLRYCLREFDTEIQNLAELFADMRSTYEPEFTESAQRHYPDVGADPTPRA